MAYELATGKNRVLTGAATHLPTLGRKTDVFVALLPEGSFSAPVQQELTIATGGDGGTTLTVTETITANIQAGQYLMFTDLTTGIEYLVKVATNVSSGSAIAIEVAIPGDGIPDGAVAQFPAYMWDRSAADLDRSFNRFTFSNFNTGGDETGIVTGGARGLATPGIYHPKNDGYFTALHAANNGRYVYVQRITGDQVIEGPCSVTAAPSASPSDGAVSADLTFTFEGKPTEKLSSADA
ncbi:MAG: hypothetical protein KME14_20315 [Tildeniella torsiva UHER 1998/13D]|jgi:hypothetical protein|nr:hypothetical protein [Tildeniella torsiva UHER 1998/13D]